MRVGLVVYGDIETRSGGFAYDRGLVEALRSRGDRVDVVSLPWRSYPRGLLDNLDPRLPRRLAGEYDVLLQDELAHPSLALTNRRLRARLDCPLVGVVHHLRREEATGRERRLYEAVERAYLDTLDGVVATSEATLRSVRRLASVDEALVAPPVCDQFDPPAVDVAARAREEPFRVVALGSVVPRKGIDTLVEALARLDVPWRLTVVGGLDRDPGYVRRVRALVAARGVDDRVALAGDLPTGSVATLLERSHVLALPSRHEGFGIAYLEGMGFGLPALASERGGAREVVEDGVTGYLVPPDDPARLALRLAELEGDRDHLARMGLAARERFEAHPTWAETGARVRAFLADLAGGPTAHAEVA
ncbi:glycosyltransferase family 4 protein [Halomarina ordinaria]|uniref:Glycosyltransferase family 4 protein n=1 Tax=Halomarina ordinaria TaxID=3033939 RepID=A0ABD5U5H4_9EURY|nr:glycosyltransferase family 4 protein [Halomarina sp. PSRA2]